MSLILPVLKSEPLENVSHKVVVSYDHLSLPPRDNVPVWQCDRIFMRVYVPLPVGDSVPKWWQGSNAADL